MKQLQSSKLLISPFSENEFIGICKAYKNKKRVKKVCMKGSNVKLSMICISRK